MSALLDEQYFEWLYSQVGSVKLRTKSKTFWSLLRQLYSKEFVWLIPNDDNRVEDGKDLRREFLVQYEIDEIDPVWMGLGCSMLEMLISLSRRLAFEVDGDPRDWFWHMLDTLDLERYCDKQYDMHYESVTQIVDETIDQVIWRTYSPTGRGGLFPLRHAGKDQRDVEIWYQLSSYLLERL